MIIKILNVVRANQTLFEVNFTGGKNQLTFQKNITDHLLLSITVILKNSEKLRSGIVGRGKL